MRSIPTSTNVIQVDTDAGEGYLKALGNREGPHVLACELVGTLLAEWLGLPVLEHALIDVTADDELPFASGGTAAAGPGFITKATEGFPWGGDALTLARLTQPEDLAGLVVLDTWIRNCDRYRPAPNLRVNHDNVFLARETESAGGLGLRAIDHTHAFTCGRELTHRLNQIEEVQDGTIYGLFPEFEPLVSRGRMEPFLQRLATMDLPVAAEMVSRVPREWEVEERAREAWARLIADRAAYVAAGMAARLWPAG